VSDFKLLDNIPDSVHVGIFTIDISEVKSFARNSVNDTIRVMFDPHIYTKFNNLIKVNKERFFTFREKLTTPAPEIEQYIEMKRFLESDEIKSGFDQIQLEIRLCRKLNEFEENLMKSDSRLINTEYLESLSWVNELNFHKATALKRTQDDLPRFREELGRMTRALQQNFAFTKASIKDFDEYIDDKEADLYYDKASNLDSALDGYLEKIADINLKLEILGEKKNTAIEKEILREKASFERYLSLWKFIATSWNVDHSLWRREYLHKIDKDQMENVINSGSALLSKLQDSFRDNEHMLKLVRNKNDEVRKFKVVLEVVKILKHPNFKDRHWDELFNDIRESDKNDSLGLREGRPDISKLTLGQLMIANITSHLKLLMNIISRATTEAETEKKIKDINYKIEKMVIKPTVFDLEGSGLSIIVSIKSIISNLNVSLTECLNMLADPNNPEEFTRELNSLVKLLTLICSVLTLIQSLQSKLIKVSPIFKFKELEKFLTRKETISQFTHVREEFKKIIYSIDEKQMKLFIEMMRSEDEEDKTSDILTKLKDLNTSTLNIQLNLKTFFKMIRIQTPRYFYATDEQMMTLCSLIKFPKSLMGFVTYFFKGISAINLSKTATSAETENMELVSLVTKAGEVIEFKDPVRVDMSSQAQMPLITIVSSLEQAIVRQLDFERSQQLQILANYNFNFISIFNHWQEKFITYQVLCLNLQILFDFEITMMIQAFTQSKEKSKGQSLKGILNSFKDRILDKVNSVVVSPISVLKGNKMRNTQAIQNLNHFVQLIMSFVAVLDYLILNEVVSTHDFNFQIIPRYSMIFSKIQKVHQHNESNIEFDEVSSKLEEELGSKSESQKNFGHSANSELIKIFSKQSQGKLVLTMMNQTIAYKYELTHPNRNIVTWPLFEKSIFSLFSALTSSPFLMLKGFPNQGKLETARAIADKIAANYNECDLDFIYDSHRVSFYVYGMISGGYWMTFKNCEKAELETLSVLASLAEEVSHSMIAKKASINFHGEEILIKGGHALMCIYNLRDDTSISKFEGLGNNITDQFRIINMNVPDFSMIISSLVSLVFDNVEEKNQWTYKLLMFCKMFKIVDTMEISGKKNSGQKKTAANQREAKSLMKGGWRISDKEVQNKSADLTLRELVRLLSVSIIKYFGSLDLYYESFKESYGSEHKNMIENLKITSDREQMFSVILKKEIMNWLLIFEPFADKQRTYSELLDNVFKFTSGKHVIDYKESRMASTKDVLKAISLFKTVFPYPKANLPENDEKIEKFVSPMIESVLNRDQIRQFIILGEPNTQKSTLIRLASFIEGELKNVRSPQYWLNLECLSREDIFGDSSYHGILREILLQTNNINLEDKNTSNTIKLNHLFEITNELFVQASDPDQKSKKPIDKQSSWIVFDSNSSKQNDYFFKKVNYLMSIFGNLYEEKEMNQFIGFSNKLKVIYEMSSIALLEPRHVSNASLIFINEGLLSLEDRVAQWLSLLGKQHPYFFKMITSKIDSIMTGFILPLIVHYTSKQAESERIFYLSSQTVLNNFLIYFEIFLNEFRKFHIAQALIEAKLNPESFLAERKVRMSASNKNSKLPSEQFSYGAGMRMAHQAGGLSMITSVRKGKTDVKIDDDQVTQLTSKEDIEEFEKRKIEGLALFSFVGAIYPLLLSRRPTNLVITIEKFMSIYCSQHNVAKLKFADGIFKMINDKKIGGVSFDLSKYLYDFSVGKWIPWENYKFQNKIEISSSFSENNFSKTELNRLNCQNSPAYYSARNQNNDEIFSFLYPVEKTIVPTSNVNQMRYMLDIFMNYKRHTLLISDHQQGKSTFLGHMYIRDLIEQRELITFNFALQHSITPKAIQTQIEDGLHKGGENTFVPPQNKRVIIWIDDLQMSSNMEKPESLVRNLQVQNGWFSSNRKNFINIKGCQFLMTLSLTEYNSECSNQSISALNTDVLSKCVLLKTHLLSFKDLNSVFFEQVKSYLSPHPDNKKEKLASKLFHQLSKVVYFNQDKLRSISVSQGLNLNLEAFCQLAKTLGLIEWEVVSENPENILFVWYHTMINFFSSDLDFQALEFQTIVEEKRSKMVKMIRTPRKSSMFESGTRQRLSIKVNLNLAEMLKGRNSIGFEDNKGDGSEDDKDAKPKSRNSTGQGVVENKKNQLAKMDLIIEESDVEESSQDASKSSKDKSGELSRATDNDEDDGVNKPSIRVSARESAKDEESKPSSKANITMKQNRDVRVEEQGSQEESFETSSDKNEKEKDEQDLDSNHARSNHTSESDNDISPHGPNVKKMQRTDSDPTDIQKIENENIGSMAIKPVRSTMVKRTQPVIADSLSSNLLTVDSNKKKSSKNKSKSGSESLQGSNPVSQQSIGKTSKRSKSRESSDSNTSSNSSDESKSKTSGDDGNSSSHMDDYSEELFENEDLLMQEFNIQGDMPAPDYFKKFIHYTMNFKMPKGMKVHEILKKVCFEKKHLFDEVLIRELKDLRETKDEAEDHTFIVADKNDEREIMEFMKTTLTGFIKLNPEALFALKLDGGNFPLLIKHFSMLAMSIMTEFQQIYLSSIKSLLYSKTLIGYVCTAIGCSVDYVELLGFKTVRQSDEKLGKIDSYEQILDLIVSCFPDIWKLKKRIIVVNFPNSATLEEHQPLLDKVLDLISSIILNTDMLNYHLGERLKEMIDMPKRDKMYVHYTEFDIKFTIRNRMQAYLTFILLNDSTEGYTDSIKIENSGVRSLDFYAYMNERYQKLAGKLSKIVVNGIKCLEPEDTPQFYTPPLPFEEIEITPMIAKCLNTELNYLRCVDKDREHFSLVKPYNENVILVNVVKYLLKMKFVYLESDVEINEFNRDKNQICQRVELRREVVQLEIKEIDSQIEAKHNEKIQVESKQAELSSKKEEWIEKRKNLENTMKKLENNAVDLAKEERMYMDLKNSMFETLRAVRDYKEKEVQTGLFASNFLKNKLFGIYSVLFAELNGTASIIEKRVQLEDFKKLTDTAFVRDNCSEYISKFEESLKNFQQGFVDVLSNLNSTNIPEATINGLSKVLETISASVSNSATFNSMQRVILKLIDTSIETCKLEHAKAKREFELIKINETSSLLKAQIEKADDFLNLIQEGIQDLPHLLAKIEERKQFLLKKREVAENSIKTLLEVVEKLNKYQQEFMIASQPMLNPSIKREELIDLMSCYIIIFNKYPFQIKKKLLYVAMQNTELSMELFEDIPIYEILSTDSLMTDTMRTKIPCNTNFLTNLSIIDFLQEEQLILYPIIQDKGKMFMKWHQSKYSKNAFYDRYVVTANSLDHIETCLRTGAMYVAIDPREELMTLIEPIIDWQFKRFTENILTAYNTNLEISDSISYFGKKIQVAKGFFLCIVLEVLPVEEIDQHIMSKMLIMDNSILNEGLFCETIADELAMNLENNTRGFYVSEYMNKSIQQSIVDKYKKLINNAKTFDFLRDSFDDQKFKQLLDDLDSFQLLLENFKREKDDRKRALTAYQDCQKTMYSLKILTHEDEQEFRFLNYPFAFKVNGFLKMMSKFMACSNRLWIYFLGLEKMKKFVGNGFAISYDILAHLLKYTISISDIKVTSADIEKNTSTFVSLFSQVELRAYQALCSMVPGSLHYIFSLILGVLLLKKRTSKKVEFTQHLSLFLLSEKILSRPCMPSLSSVALRNSMTEKLDIIKEYYKDKEDFLPDFLFADLAAVGKADEDLKSGSLQADSKIEQFNTNSITTKFESDRVRDEGTTPSESTTAQDTSLVDKTGMNEIHVFFDELARKEINLHSFKDSPNFVPSESKFSLIEAIQIPSSRNFLESFTWPTPRSRTRK
jgi:hypothetical protein